MNIKEKLIISIAAVVMLTIAIVGVTNAYSLSKRKTSNSNNNIPESISSIVYENGNGIDNSIVINNILPNTTKYKSFKIKNYGDTLGTYTIFLTSNPVENNPQFIHAKDDSNCYLNSNTNLQLYNSLGINVSNKALGKATERCFDGTYYNNLVVKLYELTDTSDIELFDDIISDNSINGLVLENEVFKSNISCESGVSYSSVSQDIINDKVGENSTKYYVLSITYLDKELGQDIENEAMLDVRINIK